MAAESTCIARPTPPHPLSHSSNSSRTPRPICARKYLVLQGVSTKSRLTLGFEPANIRDLKARTMRSPWNRQARRDSRGGSVRNSFYLLSNVFVCLWFAWQSKVKASRDRLTETDLQTEDAFLYRSPNQAWQQSSNNLEPGNCEARTEQNRKETTKTNMRLLWHNGFGCTCNPDSDQIDFFSRKKQ